MDIREILAAIDDKDKRLWSECRTAMRKVYLTAHNKVLGLPDWAAEDDAFMDLIDIKLAVLFDRAGRLDAPKTLVGDDDKKIEDHLNTQGDALKKIDTIVRVKLPPNEWGQVTQITNKE